MRPFLIYLALSMPSIACANCPQAKSDLGNGIYLTSDSPQSTRYRSDAQGHLVVETYPLGDFAFSYLATTMFGIYKLQEGTAYQGETMPDSLASMTYTVPSGNLPEPTPGLAFHSPVQTSGNEGAAQTLFVTVGNPHQTAFGDCTYETLPVLVRVTGSDDDLISWFHYVPALGLAAEWMQGDFGAVPQKLENPRLSLDPPAGMPSP